MTPDQVRVVQTTWLRLLPIRETAAQLFYDRLFELDPSLRPLFRGDIQAQGKKLMQVIDGAVNGLTCIDQVVPIVQALGRRHAGYGVKDEHYKTVGSALLWTLEKGLGAEFTDPVKAAWRAVYHTLATTMREAAADANTASAVVPPASRASIAAATHQSRVIYLFLVMGLAAVVGWGLNLTARHGPQHAAAREVAVARADPTRFLLEALLLPALDAETVPLRWVDPQRGMRCGPNTSVAVNGKPLIAGTLVPYQPFELAWHAEACRPFGPYGPRIEGQVKLTVFREDWGFSAMVEPDQLRVVSADNQTVLIEAGAESLPYGAYGHALAKMAARCNDGKLPCS